MSFADSNRVSVRAIPEETWGVTPATGVSRAKRITSSSLGASKETTTSEEIRADGMVEDITETGAASGGDINFEMAAGSYDLEVEALLRGTWSRPMTFDTFYGNIVSFTANNTVSIQGGDFTSSFVAGRRVRTDGFVNIGNNDFFEIASSSYNAGTNTTAVVFTTTTGTQEAGGENARISDANDIVVLKNTSIRLATTANTIDSNSTDAFAAAIAAGQLVPGQRVFVDGAGFDEGTVTFAAAAGASEYVIINDGNRSLRFQFGGSVPFGAVNVAPGADQTDSATNLVAAINQARADGKIEVSAKNALGVVTIRNLRGTGGAITGDAGAIVDFSGYVTNARGMFTLVTVADDALVVAEDLGAVTGEAITIKACMLRNPGNPDDILARSFSIEEFYTDVQEGFIRNGLRVGSLSLETAANSKVTGSVSYTGRETKQLTATQLGAAPYTVEEAAATRIINASTNVGEVQKNGVALSTAVQSLSLSVENNLRAQNGIGSKFSSGVGSGRINVSGSLVAYFQTGSLYQNFLNHDRVSLFWPYTDEDGNRYTITIPAAHYTSDTVAPGGIDQDVTESIEWEAKRDPVTNCMIQLDRFSSVNAVASF